MKKIAVITSGFLPVPATKGGAVENIIVNLLDENELKKKVKFHIISTYDAEALKISKKYRCSTFVFFTTSSIVKFFDKVVFFVAKNILKKKNSHSYRYIFQRLDYLNKTSKLLKRNDYDIVLLENHPTQFLSLKWRKNHIKYKGRYFYHCHNELPSLYNCEKIIKNTNKIICVSQFIANITQKKLNASDTCFAVLRNGVDHKKFSHNYSVTEKNQLRKKYNIKEKDKVLLFTGRIVPEKGVLELIQSLSRVKYKNYKLLIIGSPLNQLKAKTKYQEEIEKCIKDQKDKIVFTGFVDYDSIPLFYSIADIAVLPSIWDDPAPLTIIESLISGLPIITTNSGGIPEYATNGSAIILTRNEMLVEEMSKAIDSLLNDSDKLAKMSKIAKDVSSDLTIENYYKNFVKLINNKKK